MNRFNLYKRHLYTFFKIFFFTTVIIQMMEGDENVCSNSDPEVRCHYKSTAVSDIIVKRLDKIVIVIKSQSKKKKNNQVFVCKTYQDFCWVHLCDWKLHKQGIVLKRLI